MSKQSQMSKSKDLEHIPNWVFILNEDAIKAMKEGKEITATYIRKDDQDGKD